MLANGEVKSGERRANKLVASIQNDLLDAGNLGRVPVSIDYISAVDPITLKHVDMITGPTVLSIAVRSRQDAADRQHRHHAVIDVVAGAGRKFDSTSCAALHP